ncbi:MULTISPECIES: hypothetical protein [unclassified Novosphingobium]|uniref:hypothetical protein n=2 Tax=unclassified Novosphingobium TaxID=2644732 RepID=UPI000B2F73A9|nr:hypothetical protein [Novosphingobium sp. ST904]TCM28133.1 hypothetical protein EDF59_13042 [Novosphingobium sp. ST904]
MLRRIRHASAAAMIAAIAVTSAPGTSLAQPLPAPSPYLIEGNLAQCGPHPIFLDYALPDVGMATITPAGTMLVINPTRLAERPTAVQLFIFAHECGHLVTRGNEADADCWAIRIGRDQGWFTEENFPDLVADLGNTPGDFTHAPGPVRLRQLSDCFHAP